MEGNVRAALVGTFALAAAVLLVETLLVPGGWLPVDEAGVVVAARGGGAAGDAPGVLLSLLLTPLAYLLGPTELYDVARSLGVLVWASLVAPAYLLAHRVAPPLVALAAALLAALAPVSVYALAVVPDALGLVLGAWAFVAGARAADRRSPRLLAAGVALGVAAALARPWLAAVPLAVALAYPGAPARLLPLLRWPRSLVFAALAVGLYVGSFALGGVAPGLERALGDPELVGRAALGSLAPFALGLGVVPVLLAFAARGGPLTALLAASAPLLAVSAGLAAAGREGPALDERPLAALTPLVLALAAGAIASRTADARRLLAAAAALAAAVLVAPDGLREPALSAAPGLSLLAVPDTVATGTPVALLAVLIVAGGLLFERAGASWVVALAVAALLATQVAAVGDARVAGGRLADRLPAPRNWLDRAAPGDVDVPLLASDEPPPALVAGTAIWNASLGALVRVDPAAAEPATGVVPGAGDASLALVYGFEPAGTPLLAGGAGILYRLDPPLRVAETVEGLSADGWSGAEAVYRRFAGAPGVLRVTASRRAATDPRVPPARLTISAGPLEGEVAQLAQRRLARGQHVVLDVRTPPPPFRVVVSVAPTFSPTDLGEADPRELGAQLGFEYLPG